MNEVYQALMTSWVCVGLSVFSQLLCGSLYSLARGGANFVGGSSAFVAAGAASTIRGPQHEQHNVMAMAAPMHRLALLPIGSGYAGLQPASAAAAVSTTQDQVAVPKVVIAGISTLCVVFISLFRRLHEVGVVVWEHLQKSGLEEKFIVLGTAGSEKNFWEVDILLKSAIVSSTVPKYGTQLFLGQ